MNDHITVQLLESGHVELPTTLREKLHWLGAMELDAHLTPSGLLIQPKQPRIKTKRLEDLRGMLKHDGDRLSDSELQAPVDLANNA